MFRQQQSEIFIGAGATASSLFGGDLISVIPTSNISAPASPTAALDEAALRTQWTRQTSASTIKRRSLGRRVTFDSDVKQHDGLSTRNEVLDSVVKRYFVMQKEVSELDVIDICEKSLQSVKELHEDLQAMVTRLEQGTSEGKGAVPVLPQGGGMCTKLCSQHVPYVKILDKVVEAAVQRLARLQ